jgi:predicted CXXCH cytochrome family protein
MNWRILVTSLIGLAVVLVVFLAFLRFRGFRASSRPSSLESSFARAVRNFTIPNAESRKTNPYAHNDQATMQGRVLFLSQCAGCHGTDGHGLTPIGSNLYPRVPDLRESATQNLSDGEIHYIIENGVQMTGMPAMPGLRSPSRDDSWELVTFIRNLRSGTQGEFSMQRTFLAGAHYVGSQSCRNCHASLYDRWKKTPMANVVRDPHEQADAIIPNLKTNNVANFTADQVALVYGSIWKQRYFTKVGDDYYPLSAQWDIGNKKWLKYHVPDTGADWWTAYYPSGNMQRPTGPTCDGCHSVNYDIHTKQVTEWNVGCERCHGPGSEHVAQPTRLNIMNPSGMDSFASSDTCIQCHSQGQPKRELIEGKAYDWPVGYDVTRHLPDYWTLETGNLGQTDFLHFADGTAHKNRMQGNDFVQSVMYERGVSCASCHDVHGTENYAQLRTPGDQICLDCHAANSPNGPHAASIEAHTHHKDGSPGSSCIACHMPKIETQGVPGAFVRAHTFKFISPAMTGKYRIPNPCTSCHKDQSTDWATQHLSLWRGLSPWRVAQSYNGD